MVSTPPPIWTTELWIDDQFSLVRAMAVTVSFPTSNHEFSTMRLFTPRGYERLIEKNAAWRRGGSGWLSNDYM
jgi:hypothetical protein